MTNRIFNKSDIELINLRLDDLEKFKKQTECEHKEFEYGELFGLAWPHWYYEKICRTCGKKFSFLSKEEWLKDKIAYEEAKLKESKKQLKEMGEKEKK
jgi:hypothetical protein